MARPLPRVNPQPDSGIPARMTDPAGFDFDELFDPDDYLHFYEGTLISERTPAQVDALERALGLAPPMAVVDLGCGHGRHANELGRRGYRVTGVDLVAKFVDRAKADAAALGVSVDYRCADVRALVDSERFDAAVCLFDAFGFFGDADNLAILQAVARALVPGGRLCLDVRNRDWMVRSIAPTTVLEKGDDLMIDRHQFDVMTGRLVDRRVVVRGGRVKKTPFSVRLYGFTELRLLLELAGFAVSDVWGDWSGAPLTLHTNRMVLFAAKRA